MNKRDEPVGNPLGDAAMKMAWQCTAAAGDRQDLIDRRIGVFALVFMQANYNDDPDQILQAVGFSTNLSTASLLPMVKQWVAEREAELAAGPATVN